MTSPRHHRPGGGFQNPWPGGTPHGLADVVRWVVRRPRARRRLSAHSARPRVAAAPALVHPRAAANVLAVTWVGHTTCLVQVGGLNILTDPVWSARASPIPFLGPKRRIDPGIAIEALPPLDLVLLSHNHYDHLDLRTVRRLAARHPQAHWLAPLGVAALLERRGVTKLTELDWWQETRVGSARIACVPAQHFSGRGLRDRDATLWCGWTVAVAEWTMFFAGDTGLHPEFRAIGERYGPFDVALIPIGAYDPRWFMRPVHMDPEEAVAAFTQLTGASANAGRRCVMVPVHWGTFKLTDEPMDEPPERTRAAWANAGLSGADLWLLRPGETRAHERRR